VLPEAELLDFFDLGFRELIADGGLARDEAEREVAARAVRHIGITRAVVPGDFPLGLADRLRGANVELVVDDELVQARRRAKVGRELEGVRAAQRAAEAGMAAAAELLRRAAPAAGRLDLDGEALTAERVRAALRAACSDHGAPAPPDVIVSSVWNGTGHEPGSGPLPAGLPIQIDVWPRDEATGCWADMTRTFVVGEPAPEHMRLIADQEQLVRAALEEARAATRPGVTGRELFDATCDRFEAAGHRTQRTGPDPEAPSAGFQFSLGHGVGLEVHEAPALGLAGRDALVAGDVVAVEPGLWDPRIGGVRFEDLLLVTQTGCETLTEYPYDLAP
jgi:Xaa-Pro aminopeptidase